MKKSFIRRKPFFIMVNVPLYRIHVVLAVETTAREMYDHAKKHGCSLKESWIEKAEEVMRGAVGFCGNLGEGNRDIIIWIGKRPRKAKEYGVLYHELVHAVDKIAIQADPAHGLMDSESMSEAKAFLYEYLATELNKELWNKK